MTETERKPQISIELYYRMIVPTVSRDMSPDFTSDNIHLNYNKTANQQANIPELLSPDSKCFILALTHAQ